MNDLVSLSKLFTEKIFRIPDYQRGYAWTNPQLDDFWDDLINLGENRNHYTGMLSLKELTKKDYASWDEEKWILDEKSYQAFHVVDGQQRLTTFIIFVSCVLRLAEKHNIQYINGDDLETIRSKYIVEVKKPLGLLKAYKFGYETDNPSFDYLRFNILGEEAPGNITETFYTLNLANAKNYFDKKLEELYQKEKESGIETVFKKLTNKLQFNVHYIDDDFDVFVAFETMNNRGKKLSNLEILKNRLIYLTTIYPTDILPENEKAKLRDEINDTWKEVYFELGRGKENPLDDDEYLKNHWSLFFKYTRSESEAYVKFLLNEYFTAKAVYGLKHEMLDVSENVNSEGDIVSEYINPLETTDLLAPIEIKNYVLSLRHVAPYWYYSFNPAKSNWTEDEKKWVDRLNRIGINYYRTLVVASFINKNVAPEQRIRLFKTIEKSIFVFFRMARYQASYQSSVSINFARELMTGDKNIEDIISSLEERFKSEVEPAVDTFVTKISALFKNDNGYYSWSDLRYFLFEYEMSLYEKTHVPKLASWKSFTKSEKDKISIEHIFPQTPTRWYWRNQFRGYTDDEKKNLANSLGNLLALSQSVNSALQNDDFESKKLGTKRERGYNNGSHSEVEVANYADWNPESILQRGKHLIDFMQERWSFKFKEGDIMRVLGLEFMLDENRVIPPEIEKPSEVDRDSIDEGSEDSMKVSEYLKNLELRNAMMVDLYNAFYEKLSSKLPGLKEKATKTMPYLGIWDESLNRIICEVRIQKTQVRLDILKPLEERLQIGESFSDDYTRTLPFKFFLKDPKNIDLAVDAVIDSYNQMLR